MRIVLTLLTILWASPWSLLGIFAGLLGLLTGGRARRVGMALEFHGGAVTWFLRRCPNSPMAMTMGHTILGLTDAALDITRDHEWVHVRQYARWGPLFIPAYLYFSTVLWFQGKDPYRDNPFEREAYGDTD